MCSSTPQPPDALNGISRFNVCTTQIVVHSKTHPLIVLIEDVPVLPTDNPELRASKNDQNPVVM